MSDLSAALAREVTKEMRRQLPAELARQRHAPYREGIPLYDPRKEHLPTMQFDHKVAFWVGCYEDQNGRPLVCIDINGQIVPIAAVDDLEGLISRYRTAANRD